MEDVVLISLLHTGSPKAYAAIYFKLNTALLRFAYGMIRHYPDAQEIVQDIFLKTWLKRQDFPSYPSLRSFMYISTRNACINYQQRQRYRQRIAASLTHHAQMDSIIPANTDMMTDQVVYLLQLQQCRQVMDTLPNKCKQVMEMYFVKGLESAEIARLLNRSVHTVRNQRIRGIMLMQQRIRKLQQAGSIINSIS